MSKLLDITIPLVSGIPQWPGSGDFDRRVAASMERGHGSNVTALRMDVHTGTHIDAPSHMLADGGAMETLPLERFVGPTQVVEIDSSRPAIEAADLENAGIEPGVRRLLFKTSNSRFWEVPCHEFRKEFKALSAEAARWIVRRKIFTVGIDYLSIEPYQGDHSVHRLLMEARVAIIEGLNLRGVSPGMYELICLPLSLPGADGSPARALLRTSD